MCVIFQTNNRSPDKMTNYSDYIFFLAKVINKTLKYFFYLSFMTNLIILYEGIGRFYVCTNIQKY